MKKMGLLLLLLLPFKVFGLSASSYVVMDGESNRVLIGSNINSKKLIASTTKIMSGIVALEYGELDKEVIVSKEVLKAYGSNIYIEVGEEITLRDLIYGMLLRSGNDAAIEIAVNVAGSMENFVTLMNNKAKDLGMVNTLFINDNGLEDDKGVGNTSSAYDMGLLMSYALNNKYFLDIIGTKEYRVKTNYKSYYWENKNKLLDSYKYCVGGKTGFTKKARRTLVTAAIKDDKKLIVVTLNDPDDFSDHKYLYEKFFATYNRVRVLSKNEFKVESNEEYYIDDDIYVLVTSSEEKNIKVKYELDKMKVDVLIGDKIVSSKNILVRDSIREENNSFWSKLLDFLMFWK